MPRRWMEAISVLGAIALIGCLPESRTAGASATVATSVSLAVGPPRAALAGEMAFEDTVPLLREPENSNVAPGPRGLVAFMKADRQHHPRIYLTEPSKSDSSRLLIDRYATKPRWAPIGERLACTVWKSRAFPWNLCIVSLGRPDTLYPLPQANAVRYRWSPDAKYLAVSGTLEGGAASVLYLVDAISGAHWALDTLRVYGDYELGWSPDSRLVGASRPTQLAHTEEVLEAELWVYDVSGARVRAVSAEGRANVSPRWIDNRRLLFAQESADARSGRRAFVVEVTRGLPKLK